MRKQCQFCSREFTTNGVYAHQAYCVNNPNRKENPFKGKRHSEETKRKQAKSFKGETPENLCDVSSRTVKKIMNRLNLGCSNCGWNLASLDLHHIVPRSKGGSNSNVNLTALCPNCHRLAHAGKLSSMIPLTEHIGDSWKEHYYSSNQV